MSIKIKELVRTVTWWDFVGEAFPTKEEIIASILSL